jgi:TetR/AcrR family transcriptional regulator, cholesterol catabolism regulator
MEMRRPPETPNGKQRVLDAAAERLVAQGYTATTLREIATDIGIKAGSIYHHFESKEDLFIEVFSRGISVMVEAFESVDAAEPPCENPIDRIELHVRAHLGALFEHGSYTAAHVTAFFTAPKELRSAIVPLRDDYEHRWNSLLADVLPEFDTARLPIARLFLFGAMNTTIEWFDPRGDLGLDGLANLITVQFLEGVHALNLQRSTR